MLFPSKKWEIKSFLFKGDGNPEIVKNIARCNFLIITVMYITRRFSNQVSHLLSRSHTFAIIIILDLKIHQSMWIH